MSPSEGQATIAPSARQATIARLYVWLDLPGAAPDCYHTAGGVLVIARDWPHAVSLLPEGLAQEKARTSAPPSLDVPIAIDEALVGKVYIFPNTGCC